MDQIAWVIRQPETNLGLRPAIRRQRAIGGQADAFGIGRNEDRRATGIKQAVAIGGDKLAFCVRREAARAGQTFTLRGVDLEKSVTLYGEVKDAAGLGEAALRHVQHPTLGRGHRQGRLVAIECRDMLGEDHAFLAKARGRHVGDIVGHRLHFAHQPRLPVQRGVDRIIHLPPPRSSGSTDPERS